MTLLQFCSRSTLGVYGPHVYRPLKTVSNNDNPIAMKFNIEIVCTLAIIMGYISLEIISKKGVLGVNLSLPKHFFS